MSIICRAFYGGNTVCQFFFFSKSFKFPSLEIAVIDLISICQLFITLTVRKICTLNLREKNILVVSTRSTNKMNFNHINQNSVIIVINLIFYLD